MSYREIESQSKYVPQFILVSEEVGFVDRALTELNQDQRSRAAISHKERKFGNAPTQGAIWG